MSTLGLGAVPAPYPVICVTRDMLDLTGRVLAEFAVRAPAEGVVYWFGLEGQAPDPGEGRPHTFGVVTTPVTPDADTTGGRVCTSARANAQATAVCAGTALVLLGQVHSHPRDRVDHSPIDDRDTFAQFPGALSIVVPWFGRRGMRLESCGVHRHLEGRYRRLRADELAEHVHVLPGSTDLRRLQGGRESSRGHGRVREGG
jgi:hypothetical protein